MITIKNIADALGMAHTTVSRALNDHPQTSAETKRRVREVADSLGYVPNLGARTMRNGASRVIGLILPDIQNEFFSAVAMALADRCAEAGYQLALGTSNDDPEREIHHLRMMRESRARAILIAPCGSSSEQVRQLLAGISTIQLLRYDPTFGRSGIVIDDAKTMSLAAEHLLQHGHQTVAYIGSSLALSTGGARLQGLRDGLQKGGVSLPDSCVRVGRTLPEFGYQAALELLTQERSPTALVVGSSRQLLGAMRAVRELGLVVPSQLSILGYGDTDWFALADPPITGIALPIQEMADFTAQTLISILDDGMAPPSSINSSLEWFLGRLVVRGSTATALSRNQHK